MQFNRKNIAKAINNAKKIKKHSIKFKKVINIKKKIKF